MVLSAESSLKYVCGTWTMVVTNVVYEASQPAWAEISTWASHLTSSASVPSSVK